MVGLRGSFTTDDKKEFPSLLFLAARLVFYINNNTISNLEKTVNPVWECRCHNYSGCAKPNGELSYCDLYALNNCYHSFLAFTIRSVDYQIKTCISWIKDFEKNKDIVIFTGDYTEKSMNFYTGTNSEWSLYNYVFKSNYINYDTFN